MDLTDLLPSIRRIQATVTMLGSAEVAEQHSGLRVFVTAELLGLVIARV